MVGARQAIGDNSFLWHIRAGAVQIASGSVLTSDPFSFTFAGERWRTQSWLLEGLYAFLSDLWSLGFVPLFVGGLGLLVFLLVGLVVSRASRSVEAAAVLGVLTAWLGAGFLNPRPVIGSYVVLLLVITATRDRRLRWTLPLLAWIWASVHGSVILGIGFVILDGLRKRRMHTVVDAAMMIGTGSATAHGLAHWQVLLDFAGSREALALITEWRTPNLTTVEFVPFLVGIVILLTGAIQGRLHVRDLWIVVPFLAFGLSAARAAFPAWLAMVPVMGVCLSGLPKARRLTRRHWPVAFVLAIIIALAPLVVPTEGGLSTKFPVAAAAELGHGPMFHDDVVGGYLIYRFGGEIPVFVDDRAELYGAAHFRDVMAARSGTPAWREIFRRWSIEQALLRTDDGLVDALVDAGWDVRYEDDDFVVLIRPASRDA